MPIHTFVAGSPPSLSALSEHLENVMAGVAADGSSVLARLRGDVVASWHGEAGQAASGSISSLATSLETLGETAVTMGAAVEAYASTLRLVHSQMADARRIARGGGLEIVDDLIEGPPPPADESWIGDGILVFDSPAQEVAFRRWEQRYGTYLRAEDVANAAIESLADAVDALIEQLGRAQSALAAVVDVLAPLIVGATPRGMFHRHERLAARHRAAAQRAGFLAGLSPNRSTLLYTNMFRQMEALDDAETHRRMAKLARRAGPPADVLMIGYSAITRHQDGQSATQILLAEGGGWTVGTAVGSGVSLGARAAPLGAPAGLKGSALFTAGGFLIGFFANMITKEVVDSWYEDREFEGMVREALKHREETVADEH